MTVIISNTLPDICFNMDVNYDACAELTKKKRRKK